MNIAGDFDVTGCVTGCVVEEVKLPAFKKYLPIIYDEGEHIQIKVWEELIDCVNENCFLFA